MQDKEKLLKRIKKLLALSKSNNSFEAAKALEMAQKLMAENQLNSSDVEFSQHSTKQKFARKAPRYIHGLAGIVCKAFGCECFFSNYDEFYKVAECKSHVVFFGQEERPIVASYCFDVLLRQLNAARKEFNAGQNKRIKRSTFIARADSFCEGWVIGVNSVVKEFALTPEEKGKLERYSQQLNDEKQFSAPRTRAAGDTKESTNLSIALGYAAGKKVKLNHGVNGTETVKLGMF